MKADIKEEKKKRKWDKFSVVLMGGLAVLLLAADMGTYLRAQFLTQRQLSTPEMKDARSAESYDLLWLDDCEKNGEALQSQQWRDCLLATANSITSIEGSKLLSTLARSWLQKHPEDKRVLDVGLEAIKRGRDQLVYEKGLYIDYKDAEEIAANQSLFLRLAGAGMRPSGFELYAKEFNELEYSLMLPETFIAQDHWKTKVLGQNTNQAQADKPKI